MARFSIRVDFPNAAPGAYAALAVHLAGCGVRAVIASDQGMVYRLPPGEYNYEGPSGRQQVLDTVRLCAARVSTPCAVLVTESAGRAWVGLANGREPLLAGSACQHQAA